MIELATPLDRLLRRAGFSLGDLGYAALAVVLVTGGALGLLYDPAHPTSSLESIQGAVSYGWLLRAAHYWASQLLVGVVGLHLLDQLWFQGIRRVSAAAWWRLVVVVVLLGGAMFSGFLLRGDAEAGAAHRIAQTVLGAVPVVGRALAAVFLDPPESALPRVFLHHVVTFTVLPWLLCIEHARKVWSGPLLAVDVLVVVTVAALFLQPGLGSPPGAAGRILWGPWYFMGVQELLRSLPFWLPALVLPLVVVLVLGALRHVAGNVRLLRVGTCVWSALVGAYLVLGLAAYLLRGGG
jgi:ubiquinol-cytochrome c reductase cytochrome b subunit